METLKSNSQRAKNAIILIWIVLGVETLAFISGYMQYSLLKSVGYGELISHEEAANNDIRERVIAFLYMIVFIISAITFIMWFRRAYFNLHLKIRPLLFSEGWAAGSWFVPIICLFRPYQIMKELFIETEAFLKRKNVETEDLFAVNRLGLWWTLWIITNLVAQFTTRYTLEAKSVDEYTFVTMVSMVNNVMGVPLAIVTINIIKQYARAEVLLADIREDVQNFTPVDWNISDV
jgi:Domain of unknown function (DUF4328)